MGLIVNTIDKGIVIDHIKAGKGVKIYHYLKLDKADFTVALITNADSERLGHKDILKIKNIINIDYDVLGLIDSACTVNIIEDGKISRKVNLELPEQVENVIMCKNPRCITSIEKQVPHMFRLHDAAKKTYSCAYCEDIVKGLGI